MTILFLIIASISKIFMDLSSEDRFKSKWMNKTTGSELKYKFKPKWLFTTVLVFVTDFWHLMQFVFLNSTFLSIVLYRPLLNTFFDFIILSVGFRIIFELGYSLIKKRL